MARPQAPVGAPKESVPDADYRERLVALRDALSTDLAACGYREKAPLVARYLDVVDRLRDLPEMTEAVDVVDDLTARRARGAAAPRAKRPAAS